MIEAKMPKDIRSYKTKIIGPFTLRQIICIALCIIVDMLLYMFVLTRFNIPTDIGIYMFIFADFIIFLFSLEPKGIPMEQYLASLIKDVLLAPARRKTSTKLKDRTNVNVQTKASLNEYKKKLKEHPEYKGYR